MIMNDEQFKKEAHYTALQHDPFIQHKASKQLWKHIESDLKSLRDFVEELHSSRTTCTQPAEEWLLDHAEFIEEQVEGLRHELSKSLMNALPHIRKSGESRVSSICSNYFEHTDGHLDEESFITYIKSYQQVSVLTIAEAWALPLLMKVALIRRLTDIMEVIREHRTVCTKVEDILSGVETRNLTPEILKEVLEQAGEEMPLSGPVIVHLVKHLREHAEDTATVGEWLICKLENGPESLDHILSSEYHLQAAYQVTAGNLVGSLRKLSRWSWNDAFEKISLVEETLQHEHTGDYRLMDSTSREILRKRVEYLARRFKVPENLIASQAVELANMESGKIQRQGYVAYYLLERDGLKALKKALKMCGSTGIAIKAEDAFKINHSRSALSKSNALGKYFQLLAFFFTITFAGFSLWIIQDPYLTTLEWVFVLLLLILPASEWAVTAAHGFIERVKTPIPLLRYDFSKEVPVEAASMVVIPVIWSGTKEVLEMTDRLEVHYLANRDPNIHFAILSDYQDAGKEVLPQDKEVLETAKVEIDRLNKTYPESRFYLFQRKRLWNPAEKLWMGWERKRGKLVEFVEFLKGRKDTSIDTIIGDTSVLSGIRYIVTIDADTKLPLESVNRMIGAMYLPYNRPRLNDSNTRVIEGYGVMQPRIGMTHEAAQRSRLAALWSADPGVDPYAFAVSDPYQDALGQGIFTGKGIFDVDAFNEVLSERIPENRVLSHDLLEGGFLRVGFLSDIELIDDHPATYYAHQKRLHRWVRGDWQLLLWLLPKTNNRNGELLPVNLSILTRWQILDNLRRSLLNPVLYAILLLAVTVLPGSPFHWMALVFATLLLPLLRHTTAFQSLFRNPKGIAVIAGQVFVNIMTLPYQSVVMLDAVFRSIYRLVFSKRKLLEWVSQAQIERGTKQNGAPALLGMYRGVALSLLVVAAAIFSDDAAIQAVGFSLGLLWLATPLLIRWLDKSFQKNETQFSVVEKEELSNLASEIWSFYEDYVTVVDNWLPPDNVQFEPPNGIARRTSPTNIGLYLTCILAARDFGFIDTPGLIQRVERTLDTIERMEKWEGHLYNWYDTKTLAPLPPMYVSTVDSGNFVGCLIVIQEGLAEWLHEFNRRIEKNDSGSFSRQRNDEFQVAFAEEITTMKMSKSSPKKEKEVWGRGKTLLKRLESLIHNTNFQPLYDHKAKLFSLGYNIGLQKRDEVLYDLMASEARQASFIAIALGQISVSHWNALGRTMTKVGKRPVFLSWSGTMFEYLMPWLFMRTYRNTVWDNTYQAVVDRQIQYAAQRGVPWGISESGFYAFDHQMNYQYRAFGVPGLGFKRGLEQDLVIAPYATILALPYAKHKGMKALKQLEQLGGRGKYGFYEALDFTRGRMPENHKHKVITSFMAHHQGMSFLALVNLLQPRTMYDRFHSNKQIRSAELLLQERIPHRPKVIKHPAMSRILPADTRPVQEATGIREFTSADTNHPEVCVLSNGKFTSVMTNSGSGFTRFDGIAVSRWREDPVRDPWGSYVYIRDVSKDSLWSPSFQPCQVESPKQRIQFALDRASFLREDDDVKTSMEICVTPEWNAEIRRISLTNTGKETKVMEVTTFTELSLANPIADDAHPAFSKLFIRTDYDESSECLVAGRRKREAKDKVLWGAHSLSVNVDALGPIEYETDRSRFIGRGHSLSEPQGIRTKLQGSVGSVADPAFVMRRRFNLQPGQQVQLFSVTSVAETREDALDIVSGLKHEQIVERAFQMGWNRGQIELRNLHLTNKEAFGFHKLASQVLYTPPFRKDRMMSVMANTKGQTGLWSFGVSGDRPIILLHIEKRNHMPFVVKVLTGHEYLRRLGITFDLVLLNESEEGYHQDLQEALQRAAEHGVDRFGTGLAGVYVIPSNQLTEEDKTLLSVVARVELQAKGASFISQLRLPLQHTETAYPEELVPVKAPHRYSGFIKAAEEDDSKEWLFYNGWGGFSPDGTEYRIIIKNGHHLPAPWINVLANSKFGCIVSELYTGYSWWGNSRECKLTPWANDPVLDPPTETGFLRDEESGEVWSFAPSAVPTEPPYQITHGRGFTRFNHERNGIKHEMKVFVPLKDPVKIMQLRLSNQTSEQRSISVTYYAEWVLGVQRSSSAPYIVTDWDKTAHMLTASNHYQETFREATAFLGIYTGDSSVNSARLTWTADRHEFIGRNGNLNNPAALRRVELSGRTGALYDSCGAIQAKLLLEPNEERDVYILLGCEQSKEAAAHLVQKYSESANCEQAWEEVREYWDEVLNQVVVSTPSLEMNVLLNGWLLYQSLACRIWARSALYQAGGAFGFRDQLQDTLALLHTLPEVARAQIVRNASHQYEEGDVQHWWHEETERGIRTLFSDDLLWLPYAVSRYIEHTDESDILEEQAPFLHSEPLQDGEHERYEPTVQSSQTGTVYEHCLRAIDKALQRIGEHGLPLIGVGDWNDGMNLVGDEGRGESVWLGWFVCDVLQRFAKLCSQQGDEDRTAIYLETRERITASLHEHAWDGQWYRRAFTDDGQWLGSIHNEECRIDAIAQSWSVISGAAPKERSIQAMQSFDRELVDRKLSIVRLLTPPFDHSEPSPGYIQGYPPGIRENGAQYTHGVIWSIVAYSKLGKGDQAFELFHMLNPLTHTRTDHEVMQYVGEPYVMAADVYTASPHEGHAGWTWYTGASGWMYQAGIEWILGIRRRGSRLYIDPCIPADWPGFSLTYRFGKTCYFIEVEKTSESSNQTGILKVDGQEILDDGKVNNTVIQTDIPTNIPTDIPTVVPTIVPTEQQMNSTDNQEETTGRYVELQDDGQDHQVELTIKR